MAAAAGPDVPRRHRQPRRRGGAHLREVLDVRDGQTLTPELYHDTVVRWKRRKRVDGTDLVRRAEPSTASGADNARQFLNAAEIRELAAAGIAFGSHTVTHRILPHYGRRRSSGS